MARKKYELNKLIKETPGAYVVETKDGRTECMPKKSSTLLIENGISYLLCEEWSWNLKLKQRQEENKVEKENTTKEYNPKEDLLSIQQDLTSLQAKLATVLGKMVTKELVDLPF